MSVPTAFKLGLRQLRRRPTRYLLAAFGVSLGVALLFGTLVAGHTVQAQLERGFDDLTGRAHVSAVASAPGADLPDGISELVATLPGVAAAVPSLSTSVAVAGRAGDPDVPAALTGVEPELAEEAFGVEFAAGRLAVPGAPEAMLPRTLADELGVGVGDTVWLPGPDAPEPLRVVGVLQASGAGLAGTGGLVITSLPTAEELLGKPGARTRVDIVLADGTDPDGWIAEQRQRLPDGVILQDTSAFLDPFVPFLRTVTWVLALVAAGAGAVAAYLVYVTMARAMQTREGLHATLRALGMGRAQLRRGLLAESALLGLVCVVVGIVLGAGLALGLAALLAAAAGMETPPLRLPVHAIVLSAGIGMAAVLLGTWGPARVAARTEPAAALRALPTRSQRPARGWIPGVVLTTAGAGALLPGVGPVGAAAGALALLAGAALLVPAALRPVAAALRHTGPRAVGWTTRLAGLQLHRDRRRTGAVAALLTVVLALAITTLAAIEAISGAMLTQLERQFGADVQVSAPTAATPAIERTLAATAGVAAATSTVTGDALLLRDGGEEPVTILALDPASYFSVTSLPWVEGTDHLAAERLSDGGVVLPSGMAERLGVSVGQPITLQSLRGPIAREVVGTYASLVTGPQVVMAREDARALLGIEGSDQWHVRAADGESVTELRARLTDSIGAQPGVTVTTAAAIVEDGRRELAAYRTVVFAIVLVAGGAGLVGFWAALSMAVLDRTRELGGLRAVGALQRQVRRLVVTEGAVLMAVALAAATAAGLLAGRLATRGVGGALGLTLTPQEPWPSLAALAGAVLVVAVLVALGPAMRAARLDVGRAVRTE